MINVDSNKTYQSFEVFYKINYFGESKFNIWDFLWPRVYCKFVGQSALRNKSAAKKKRTEQAEKNVVIAKKNLEKIYIKEIFKLYWRPQGRINPI